MVGGSAIEVVGTRLEGVAGGAVPVLWLEDIAEVFAGLVDAGLVHTGLSVATSVWVHVDGASVLLGADSVYRQK